MAKAKDQEAAEGARTGDQPESQPGVTPSPGATPSAAPSRNPKKKVRVICEGFLGSNLLVKGDVTSDPDYVALIDDPRELVEVV